MLSICWQKRGRYLISLKFTFFWFLVQSDIILCFLVMCFLFCGLPVTYSLSILHRVAWYFFKLNFGRSLYILNPNFLVFLLQIFSPGLLFDFLTLYAIYLYIFSIRSFKFWCGHIYKSFKNFSFLCPVYEFLPQVMNIFLYIFSYYESHILFWLRVQPESMCPSSGIMVVGEQGYWSPVLEATIYNLTFNWIQMQRRTQE